MEDEENYPFKIEKGENDEILLGGIYQPIQLTACFLTYLKYNIVQKLGEEIIKVVIGIPAYFSSAQKKATREAGISFVINTIYLTKIIMCDIYSFNCRICRCCFIK